MDEDRVLKTPDLRVRGFDSLAFLQFKEHRSRHESSRLEKCVWDGIPYVMGVNPSGMGACLQNKLLRVRLPPRPPKQLENP
jgi:hypothetical protein